MAVDKVPTSAAPIPAAPKAAAGEVKFELPKTDIRQQFQALASKAKNEAANSTNSSVIPRPTHVSVFQGHDGMPDEDDNGAMIAAAGIFKKAAKSGKISQSGLIYGDTKDDWRKKMADLELGSGDKLRGQRNYNFFKKFGKKAVEQLGYSGKVYDTIPQSSNGFKGQSSGATDGAVALANDIMRSIIKDGRATVYMAGGGQNVPAEAISLLQKAGFSKKQIRNNFSIIQHSNWNFFSATEPQAQKISKEFTMFISDQNETLGVNSKVKNISGNSHIAKSWNEAVDKNVSATNNSLPQGKRDVSDAGEALFITDAYKGKFNGKIVTFADAFADARTRNWDENKVRSGGWNPSANVEQSQGRILFLEGKSKYPNVASDVAKIVQTAESTGR